MVDSLLKDINWMMEVDFIMTKKSQDTSNDFGRVISDLNLSYLMYFKYMIYFSIMEAQDSY